MEVNVTQEIPEGKARGRILAVKQEDCCNYTINVSVYVDDQAHTVGVKRG